jgi:hypothetical protein
MAYDSSTREDILHLLHRLDRPEDDAVLAAARELAAKVKSLEVDWEGLLVEAKRAAPMPVPASGDTAAVLRALLGRDDLMIDTREDLQGFQADLEAGRLDEEDRRYIHALHERLSRA